MIVLGLAVLPAALAQSPAEAVDEEEAWGELLRSERLRGAAMPSRQVKLGAPLSGVLAEIAVDEGETVEEGQVIAQMDESVQALAVEAAALRAELTGRLDEARLLLEEAEEDLERIATLRERDATSSWELRRARLERDKARAAVRQVEEQRDLSRAEHRLESERLERHRLRAPFGGIVVRLEAEPGASLNHGDEVALLVGLDPLEAELDLPVTLYGRLSQGRKYRLQASTPVNDELVGTLTYTEPLIDVGSATFRCVLRIENPERRWPAGFNVRLAWPPVPVDEGDTADDDNSP
ncbi:MAG: efflux RND transporter periplasmic adaptor subunit [Phycisphaeraceae bacterium]